MPTSPRSHHLAAVYDLSTPREFAWKVNVEGTRNVLEMAGTCKDFQRLQYVSTCYVSGRHTGIFRETDLQVGQVFNNYYEETKYHAEIAVQEAIKNGLPATVYRPSIVVGDSHTGETQKYDGPYYAMQLIARHPGCLRRLVPQPFLADLRLHAGVSRSTTQPRRRARRGL